MRRKLISDHGLFFPTRTNKERRTGKIPRAFARDAQGFGRLNAGSCVGFTSSRSSPPMELDITIFLFLHDVWPCLLVKTD